MVRVYLVLLLLVGLAMRCGHAHSVRRQPAEPGAAQEGAHGAKAASQKPGRQGQEEHDGVSGEASQDKGAAPPLAISPAGLVQPGAITALQDKLIDLGYLQTSARSGRLDDKTERALRDFQRDQGLPATGTPDDLTVQKLGLSPRDVFRASTGGSRTP